ncbi:MAG TPA: 50S ribosomal protein L25 [bacterium]|jgi:large subunit ribosomal protein L25|nr:50S ribosomal protein L25 [bacterium]
MSEAIKLSATTRQGSLADKKDFIPAVMYGSGVDNTMLDLKRPEFEKVFIKSGESGLITLKLDEDQEYPVIVKDFQVDPIKQRIIHVDFFKLNMKEKVVAEVALEFIGEAPAVKTYGGIVIQNFNALEIECLPSDLIQKIDIDLSILKEVGDAIHVSDIKLPDGVVFKQDLNDLVVNVVEPKKVVEEVVVAPEAEVAPAADAAKTEEKKDESKKDSK